MMMMIDLLILYFSHFHMSNSFIAVTVYIGLHTNNLDSDWFS